MSSVRFKFRHITLQMFFFLRHAPGRGQSCVHAESMARGFLNLYVPRIVRAFFFVFLFAFGEGFAFVGHGCWVLFDGCFEG